MTSTPEQRLHDSIGFVGLRAHATAAAVLQICAELRRAGIFDQAALERIKQAVAREIALSQPRREFRGEFEAAMARLDELFSGQAKLAFHDDLGPPDRLAGRSNSSTEEKSADRA